MKKILGFMVVLMAMALMMKAQAAPDWFLILEPDVEFHNVGEHMEMYDVKQCKKGFKHTHPYAWRSVNNNRRDQFMVDDPYLTRDGRLCRDSEYKNNRGEILITKSCCTNRVGHRCTQWAQVPEKLYDW